MANSTKSFIFCQFQRLLSIWYSPISRAIASNCHYEEFAALNCELAQQEDLSEIMKILHITGFHSKWYSSGIWCLHSDIIVYFLILRLHQPNMDQYNHCFVRRLMVFPYPTDLRYTPRKNRLSKDIRRDRALLSNRYKAQHRQFKSAETSYDNTLTHWLYGNSNWHDNWISFYIRKGKRNTKQRILTGIRLHTDFNLTLWKPCLHRFSQLQVLHRSKNLRFYWDSSPPDRSCFSLLSIADAFRKLSWSANSIRMTKKGLD